MAWFAKLLSLLFGKASSTICDLVRQGNAVEVERLLKAQPELVRFNQNQYRMSPLHVAANDGHSAIVKMLLKHSAPVDALDRDNSTPLFSAALAGQAEIVELLAAAGANVNHRADEGVTPLHVAAMNDHLETVKCLLKRGALKNCSDDTGATPLSLAPEGSEVQRLLSS